MSRRSPAAMAHYRGGILDAVEYLRPYWPVTLRTIWYRLVADMVVENDKNRYKQLSDDLTKLRESGLVPWESMEDNTRTIIGGSGWSDREAFVEYEVAKLFKYYRRDRLQSQPNRLEIWIEKAALSKIVAEVASREFGVKVVIAKGFSSTSIGKDLRDRIDYHRYAHDQATRILYLGDLDPSGWDIPRAIIEVADRNGVAEEDLSLRRIAMNLDQSVNYPSDPDNGIKPTDSRTPRFLREVYGVEIPEEILRMPQGNDRQRTAYRDALTPYCRMGRGVELDAFAPPDLQELVRTEITAELDLSAYEEEQERQDDDIEWLAEKKREATQMLTA